MKFQSTHPMRGATSLIGMMTVNKRLFQSTHPMRGATLSCDTTKACVQNFNPRTPCGVRRKSCYNQKKKGGISIHAPHAGCDRILAYQRAYRDHFNPRTPCGVRRFAPPVPAAEDYISIHAPPAGCDAYAREPAQPQQATSIHTPMRRGATFRWKNTYCKFGISIHTPARGATMTVFFALVTAVYFNPRTPCGVRRIPDGT